MTELIYILFAAGIALWQYPLLYTLYLTVRNRFIIRRNLKTVTDGSDFRSRSPIGRHLELVIQGAEAGKIFTSLENFYLCSLILGLGCAFAVYLAAGISAAIFSGLFMGAVPYGALMARLHGRRVARSQEGDILVRELLNNYKIGGFNIREAIETTAVQIRDAPGARSLLLRLAKGLQRAAGKEEVEKILENFRYSIDTVWGNALATNIFFAYLYGVRVDGALEDLLAGMTKSRKVIEHGKRENNEARLMLKYLAPISFLLTVVCACRYFGFTVAKFIKYQLGTAMGLQWFVIVTMMYIGSLLLNGFLSKEKMDI